MNSVNSSLRSAKDAMMPAALRRKLDSPNSKAVKPAPVAKEEVSPAIQASSTQSVIPPAVPDGKAAAPQRPPPRPADAAAVPQLNSYARAQLPKGEVIMSSLISVAVSSHVDSVHTE